MPQTTGRSDIEILLADGTTWLPLMLARPRGQDGIPLEGAALGLQEVMVASDNDLPISKRLQVVEQEDWSGGVGIDYHEAPGVYTRTGNYACPAGAATAITLPAPTAGTNNSQIVSIRQFGTDLFAAVTGNGTANNGRVMRSTDNGTTWTNSLDLGANEYARDLLSFDNGSGTEYLYVSVSNVADPNPGTAAGYFYRWSGAAWSARSSAAAASWARQRLAKVFWVTQDGVGDWRMVTISGSKTISYTRPGVDPFTNSTSQWVEGVKIRTGVNLLRLAAANRHIYVTAKDGVFDLDEQGNAPNLTSYTDTLLHGANGLAALYLDGYVYNALGQGLDRISVESAGVLQENVGFCAPGWGTRARTKWSHAWTTELHQDQGYLVNAVYNPGTGESGIFWGKDRRTLGVETPNPLVWYGPEVVLTGSYKVTAMRSFSPNDDDLRLFVAAWAGGAPVMFRVSLPVSGSPIDDLISGGNHRFATGTPVTVGGGTAQPYSRIHLIDEAFGSRTSLKIIHTHKINAEGLGGGTKLVLEERADPAPSSTTWTTSTDVTTIPAQEITPASVVSGHRIERRISFVAASSTTPAVLDAIRTAAWRVVPSVGVRIIDVEYGDGVSDLSGHVDETFSPDTTTSLIETLIAAGGRTTMRDRQDRRWTIRLEQVLAREETLASGTYGKTVKARLEVDVLAAVN